MNRILVVAGALAVLTVPLAGAVPVASAHPIHNSSNSLNIVGYSTPGPVYGSQSTPGTLEYAFAHTKAGKGVSFNNSFAASDSQSLAVTNGQPADVVNFSYATNTYSLVAKHLVASNWDHNTYRGFVTDTVVAFGVRPGNPKHIKGWSDLVKSGVGIVSPSTTLSGSAKWNVLGAYAYASKGGQKNSAGVSYLKSLFKNIVNQPKSGSSAVSTFLNGIGDVVIGYEDDVLSAIKAHPGKIQLVVPPQSLLIENPLAVTLKPAAQNTKLAKAFYTFLYSKQAQTIWAQNYYWPVVNSVYKKFKKNWPVPKTRYNVRQFGGWPKIDSKFFATPNGVWTKIENGG